MKTNHILLIDDNEIDNIINNHIIAKSKIAEIITTKYSAVEALEYLELIKNDFDAFPDLIFLDISMPIMDGFGFLEEVIKFPKLIEKQCSVVMLSSSDDQNDIARAMNSEVVIDYFTKPLKIGMINDLIKRKSL